MITLATHYDYDKHARVGGDKVIRVDLCLGLDMPSREFRDPVTVDMAKRIGVSDLTEALKSYFKE